MIETWLIASDFLCIPSHLPLFSIKKALFFFFSKLTFLWFPLTLSIVFPFFFSFFNQSDLEKDLYLYQTELEADLEKMEKLYKAPHKKPQKVFPILFMLPIPVSKLCSNLFTAGWLLNEVGINNGSERSDCMACCVAVRNNRMWCWESSLKSISDTVISCLTPPPRSHSAAPTPIPVPVSGLEFSVCKKNPLYFSHE